MVSNVERTCSGGWRATQSVIGGITGVSTSTSANASTTTTPQLLVPSHSFPAGEGSPGMQGVTRELASAAIPEEQPAKFASTKAATAKSMEEPSVGASDEPGPTKKRQDLHRTSVAQVADATPHRRQYPHQEPEADSPLQRMGAIVMGPIVESSPKPDHRTIMRQKSHKLMSQVLW